MVEASTGLEAVACWKPAQDWRPDMTGASTRLETLACEIGGTRRTRGRSQGDAATKTSPNISNQHFFEAGATQRPQTVQVDRHRTGDLICNDPLTGPASRTNLAHTAQSGKHSPLAMTGGQPKTGGRDMVEASTGLEAVACWKPAQDWRPDMIGASTRLETLACEIGGTHKTGGRSQGVAPTRTSPNVSNRHFLEAGATQRPQTVQGDRHRTGGLMTQV